MIQATPHISATSSRLARFLADLGAAAPVSHRDFTQRLGQLFDLADSIKLSKTHRKPSAASFKPGVSSAAAIREEFLRARASIVSSTLRSFVPGADPPRLRFPLPTADGAAAETIDPEPYLTFYSAQQREIDFRIRNLHAKTRDELAGCSPALAQIAALDSALGGPIAAHSRPFFAAVPELLQNRIDFLRSRDDSDSNAALEQIRNEIQGLLLAEIETRLLPTLGLIEALDELDDE